MERYTRTRDGRTERWELARDGVTLTERESADGAGAFVRVARCDTEATAEGIAARMVARHERAGFVREPAAEAAPGASPAKPAAKPAPPPFPGLDARQLAAAVSGVAKAAAGDAYKVGAALQKAVGDWTLRVPVAWHLARHKLVPASTMPGLWELLAGQPDAVDVDALLDLLAALPAGAAFGKLYKYGAPTWFTPGFDRSLDELLFAAYQRDRARVDARAPELPDAARLALDFVRGRSAVAVAPERARAILRHVATAQCKQGLATNWELARVTHGVVSRPRVGTVEDVREVALRFGPLDAWRAAMADAVRAASEFSAYTQHDGLVACDLGLLAAKLAGAFSFSDNSHLARILAVLEARGDAPEALVEAAAGITGSERHPAEVRDMLAVVAAGRFAAQGKPVPESVDALLDLSFFSGVYHVSIAPYERAMAALPRKRALRLAERRLAEPFGYAAGLAPLLAHRDDALLGRFVDHDAPNGYLDAIVLGRFGAEALPHLARIWDLPPRSARRARHRAALHALATMGDRGETADPAWDEAITFDQEGDEPIRYWDGAYASLRARALRSLPEPRRRAQLLRCAAERPWPERAKEAAAAVLDAEGAAAVEAAAKR